MKRRLAISLLLCLSATAFAIDLSAGGGMTVGSFCSTYNYTEWVVDEWTERWTSVPVGFVAFLDATYGVAAIGYRANGSTQYILKWTAGAFSFDNTNSDIEDDDRSGFLSIALLGRYPFALGQVSLFPLLGIEYDLNLCYQDENGADLKASLTDQENADLNQFWFKAGVGADISISKSLYVRPLVLLGFKLLNSAEKADLQDARDNAASARYIDFTFEGGVQAGWRF
jgi:hypothetical protein